MKTKAYEIFKKNYAELGKKHFYKIRNQSKFSVIQKPVLCYFDLEFKSKVRIF